MFKGSWRTTAAAVLVALAAIFGAAGALLDGDPKTNPNWELIMVEIGAAGGLLTARDNKVKSETVGAK